MQKTILGCMPPDPIDTIYTHERHIILTPSPLPLIKTSLKTRQKPMQVEWYTGIPLLNCWTLLCFVYTCLV